MLLIQTLEMKGQHWTEAELKKTDLLHYLRLLLTHCYLQMNYQSLKLF